MDGVNLDALKDYEGSFPGHKVPTKVYRKCLKCQKNFRSESPTNRICVICSADNEKYTASRVIRVVNNSLNGVDRLEGGVMGR
jgi:DNA-directed RNA polymerase subunit RPC12/RpoP